MRKNPNTHIGAVASAAKRRGSGTKQSTTTGRDWAVEESTDPGLPDFHWKVGAQVVDGNKTQRCVAGTSASGGAERCRQPAIKGTSVCRYHGGAAPNIRAAAERRQSEAEVAAVVSATRRKMRLGEGPVEDRDPALVLNDLLSTVRGDLLALRQAAMTVDLTGGTEDEVDHRAIFITSLYGQWLDRAAKLSESLVKIHQSDRSLNMAESITALERIQRARELGLDEGTRAAAVTLAAAMRKSLIASESEGDNFAAAEVRGGDEVIIEDAAEWEEAAGD